MKLRKFIMVFIVISVMATFPSCDLGWDLLINDSEKVEMNFNNSKIVLSAGCLKGRLYGISMEYDLESKKTIHTDAEYQGKTIEN
jgi:hypothetical protein